MNLKVADVIYFIQQGSDGPIKIGHTGFESVSSRIKALQTASPFMLRLLVTMEGDLEKEKILYSQFKAYRLHGEWFQPCVEVLAYISNLERLKKEKNHIARLEEELEQVQQARFELQKQIKSLNIDEHLVNSTPASKPVGNVPSNFLGWTVKYRGGFYRCFKKLDGKVRGVHIGKEWNESIARTKIADAMAKWG
jgi:hypothetical protein